MSDNISMEEFLAIKAGHEKSEEENVISMEEFLAIPNNPFANQFTSGSESSPFELTKPDHITVEQLEDHRWGRAEKDIAKKLTEIYGDKFEITEEKKGSDAIKIKNKANGKWEIIDIDQSRLGSMGMNRPYEDILTDIINFIESSTQEDVERTEDYTKRKEIRDITGGSISTDDNINYIDERSINRERFFARDGEFGDFDPVDSFFSGGYNPERTETNTEKLEEITSDISNLFQQELRAERRKQFGAEFEIPEHTKKRIIQDVFERLNKAGNYLLPMDQFKKITGGHNGLFFEKEKVKFEQTYEDSNRISNKDAEELDTEIKKAIIGGKDVVDKNGKFKGIYGSLDKPWQNKADLVAERKTYEDALNAINNKIALETRPEELKKLNNIKNGFLTTINNINKRIDDNAINADFFWDYKTRDLASKWAAQGYSEYRANEMAEAFDQTRSGGLDDEVAIIKKQNPTLNDRQALDLYLNKLIIGKQKILKDGKEKMVSFNLSKLKSSDREKIDKDFINKVKQTGYWSENLDGTIGDIKISVADLMGLGFDARDFRGWYDGWRTDGVMNEEDLEILDTYEEARDHNHAVTRAVYELTHLDRNPDDIVSGTGSVEGAGMNTLAFVSALMEKGQTAIRTQWFDASNREANQSIASMRDEGTSREYTDRAMLDNMNIAAREFNQSNIKEIEEGKISALVWTDDQLQSINRTFADNVAEGVGEFVPTLIELAAITLASEGALTVTGGAVYLARLKRATDVYSKMKYHASMLALEEIKMQTAGFKAGSGAAFYGLGALTPWFRPGALPLGMGTTMKGLDPLWQKTFGAGITGAAAGEFAQITELGWEHLKGEQDFKSEMKHLFGDFDEVEQRMMTNAVVFGIAHNMGKGRIKGQDLHITTQMKYNLRKKINRKMEDLLYEKEDLKEVQRLRKEKEQNEKDWKNGKKTEKEYQKELDSIDNALELYREVGLRDYKDLNPFEKARHDAYENTWMDVNRLYTAQAFAKELDPHGGYSKEGYAKLDKPAQDKITESFKENYQRRVIDPINTLMRRANEGHKDLVVEFTDNRAGFEHDINGRDLGNVAEYDKIKNTILFDKSKFSIGTSNHELVHMALRQVFKGNERMEVNFTKRIDRVFEDAFGKKLNDFLREGVEREYQVSMEGMNKKLREQLEKGDITKAQFEKGLKENEKKRQQEEFQLQQEEFLSNLAEVITNPDVYYSKINNTFMKNAKQEVYQFLEESFGGRFAETFKPQTAHGFINFLGRLGDSGRKGRDIKGKVFNLSKLEDISFLGIRYRDLLGEGKMASKGKGRDLYKEKELLKQDNLTLGRTKPKDTGRKFPKTRIVDGKSEPHPKAGQPMTWRDIMTANTAEIKDLNKLIEKSEKTQKVIDKLEPLHEMSKSKDYGDKNPEAVELRRSVLVDQLRENNMGYLNDFIEGPYGFKKVQGSEVTKEMFSNYVKNTEFNKFINTYFNRAKKFKDVPFGAYLRDNIHHRQGNILKALGASKEAQAKRVKTQSLQQMMEAGWDIADKGGGDAGGRTNAPKDGKVGIEIINKLPVTQSHIRTIEKIAETIDIKNLDYKTLLDQAPEATKKMFGKKTQDKANFIANHWQTLYDLLPKNLTETTGTATGIENSLMTRVVPEGTDGAYKKKNKKGKVVWMKNVFYEGLGETVKMKKTGAKTGTELQSKIRMGKREFLAELGIKDKRTQEEINSRTGDVDISGMNVKVDRGITTGVLPALINQTGKAITNQVTRFAPELKNRPDIQGLNVLENLRNQLASGKSDKLAGKNISENLVKEFTEDYMSKRIDNSNGINIHMAAILLEDKRYNKFSEKEKQQLVDFIDKTRDLYDPPVKETLFKEKIEEGILTEIRRQEGFYGKKPEVVEAKTMSKVIDYFEKEFEIKVEDKSMTGKDGYSYNRKDIANDIKWSDKFINKFAKDNPKILQLLTVDMGSGNTKEYGKRRNKTDIKEILLSKGIEPTVEAVNKYYFKKLGMNFKGSKVDYGTSLDAVRIADPGKVKDAVTLFLLKNSVGKKLKGKELDMAMHDVYLGELTSLAKNPKTGKRYTYQETLDANKKLREIYFENIRDVLLEAKAEGKLQEAFTWFLRHSQRQTNIGQGINKGTFSIMFGSTILGEKSIMKTKTGTKDVYFHSEHNMQLLNNTLNFGKLVLETGNNNKKYKERFELLDREAHQAIVPKEWTKIYDSAKYGGPAKLDPRFANKNLGEISSIINFLIKPGSTLDMLYLPGKRGETVGEYLLGKYSDFQVKEILKLAKAPESLPLQKLGVLSRMKMASKGAFTPEQLKKAKITDKALELGRKKNKKSKGMSTWDFDDTLATTKSGVRARVPNVDGKPKPSRKVIFLAGGAGSGKGNVIKKLNLEGQGFKIVNSDISLEWLKKNHGLPENMNDFTKEQRSTLGKLQHQSRGIAKRKMMKYQGNADGVVIDGTGGSLNVMRKQVQEFKDKGYDVSMLFVETSLETALARNKARKERSLLDKIVEKNHDAVQGNKLGFRTMFGERFMEVKTDKLKQEDAMPADLISKMNDFVSSYEKIRLDAEQFATEGKDILDRGGEFDFAEFNVVTGGEKGPFFQKALERAKKFGTKDQFILTARPPEAAIPIREFLKSQGLDIPLENITGLGNSTAEAKAMWMLKKFSEGYNDMYFADDARQNVRAVKDALGQLEVKAKVVQAKTQKEKPLNNVKDVNKLDSPDTYSNILASKGVRLEFEKTIAKRRPDLVKENLVSKAVDDMINFVEKLDVPINKRKKYQRITTKWLATSNIKLKEDGYKIKQAVEIAEKYKEDIFSYTNPNQIIEKYAGKIKEKPTNPKTVKEFAKSTVTNKKHGITEHVVENTREGQEAVRRVMDTHFGENSNPWCLAQKKNGKLTENSWEMWEHYSDGPKSLVFQNGKLIGFKASGEYWDRMDNATDAPVIKIKDGRVTKTVELVPISGGKVSEFVMETRTVSKDKKTVTTEYFYDKPLDAEGYAIHPAGTKIVERRVNGQTTRETTYRPNGDVKKTTNFKDGKAIETRTFRKGKTTSINNETRLDVEKHGDMINYELTEGKNDLWFGEISMEAQGFKNVPSDHQFDGKNIYPIGFETPVGFDVMNVMKRVDGKLRVDFKKILEIDPNMRGDKRIFDKQKIMEGMQAIEPVKQVLDQLDVKSEVQQTLAGKNIGKEINDILESTFGVESKKRFSTAEGKMRGKDKKRRRFFIPDSAGDLELLIEPMYGKGKEGIENKKWFEENFYKPWERGVNDLHTARQTILNDYMSLRKNNKDVVKSLDKPAGKTSFTNDQAARVYIWDKAGFEIPGLTKASRTKLLEYVTNNPELQVYAENVAMLTKIETGLKKPKETWWAETLATEVSEVGKTTGREKYIGDWIERKNEIFSKENLAKMESELGPKWRSAMDNMLYRMETGTTKPKNLGRIGNGVMNYLNGSVGTIMNLNTRSATLQLISTVNFINHAENNPLRAAQAFANQPQYWKDFMKIMNSDMLKQRRNGLQINVTEAELAAAVDGKGSKAKRALAYILKQGYIPTKIADSFAISTGGATYYRNRIRMYEKQGLKTKEAERKAWLDFQEIAEKTQQSSRPDLLSQQQVSFEGRLLLPFANTPMQMNRIMMKEMLDLSKGRYEGAFGENSFTNKASKIAYYGFIQSAIFAGLQTGAFALMANSDDDEQIATKKTRAYNTMADSFLRGLGIGGVVVSGVKNAGMKFYEQNQKGFGADYSEVAEALLNMSPTIGSKFSKMDAAGGTYQFNKKEILEKGLSLDNTKGMEAAATTIEALTNVPIARVIRKTENIQGALDQRNEAWQRFLMGLGWSDWDIGGIEYQEKKDKKKKGKGRNGGGRRGGGSSRGESGGRR